MDPDFGWHLTTGRLVLEKGIPSTDPFTYSMPDFAVVDHEWLTDVIIAKLYPIIGMVGLAFISSLLTVSALYISLLRVKGNEAYKLVAVLLGFGILSHFFGVRPQVLSWFFLSLFLWLLDSWDKSHWIRFLMPLLFLFWVNLHGGFAVGIVLLVLYFGIKSYKAKRVKFIDLLVVLLSVGATFVNAYGVRIWLEVVRTFFSTSLRWGISEWLPGATALVFCLPLIVVLGTYFIYRFRKKFTFEAILINVVFLLMAVSAIFQIPYFVISVMPFIVLGISYLRGDILGVKEGIKRFNQALRFLTGIVIILFILDTLIAFKDAWGLSEKRFYPKDAVAFISAELPKGEIFSEYGWGGYLIWKLPQKKVYIDGRMPHWPGILKEHSDIILGKGDYRPVFDKYGVEMVLWPTPKDGKEAKLIINLRQDGWHEVYKDDVAVVLIKEKI